MGATACIVVPWFTERYQAGADWRALAWWIHDHLPYSRLQFFPTLCAFNIQWHEKPEHMISSFIAPKGTLTKPGMQVEQQGLQEMFHHMHCIFQAYWIDWLELLRPAPMYIPGGASVVPRLESHCIKN